MRLRVLVIAAALAVGIGSATTADPAFAAVPSPGGGPTDSGGRSVVLTGALTSATPGGTAILRIDVGRRHPQEKPLSIVTTAATVITKGGRSVRLTALNGAKVTVTGKRAGDRITASKVAA